MYPRIGFLRKMTYPRIRIGPIPIHVSVSVLHSLHPLITVPWLLLFYVHILACLEIFGVERLA